MSKRWLTVADVCDELGVTYRTWEKWHLSGRGPKTIRLPNGSLRIEAAELEAWLGTMEAA